MNIEEKISELRDELKLRQAEKKTAHERTLVIKGLIRKLTFSLRDVNEILGVKENSEI